MSGAGWLTVVIVGGLTGLLATTARLDDRTMPGGWIGGVVSGLIGAYLGGVLLGRWGWMLGGFNVIGGLIGGLVVAYLVEAFGGKRTSHGPGQSQGT